MENNWVLVYTGNMLYVAEILREYLADNNIRAFIINKQDSFYKFGDIELYVLPEDVMKSKVLIEKFEKNP